MRFAENIRNNDGFWQQVETDETEHGHARCSHGIRPDGIKTLSADKAGHRLGPGPR